MEHRITVTEKQYNLISNVNQQLKDVTREFKGVLSAVLASGDVDQGNFAGLDVRDGVFQAVFVVPDIAPGTPTQEATA